MNAEAEKTELPLGFYLEADSDGDWTLIPPDDVTIFSIPGEGLLIGQCDRPTAISDALEHLHSLGLAAIAKATQP